MIFRWQHVILQLKMELYNALSITINSEMWIKDDSIYIYISYNMYIYASNMKRL